MGLKTVENIKIRGFVDYELIDDATDKVIKRGKGRTVKTKLPRFFDRFLPLHLLGRENAILNTARNKLADAFIGTSVTYPTFIGIGTGTNTVAASDTALQTPVDYDGANEAKVVDTKSLLGQYTSRLVVQFTTTEANQTIGELGLFDAANSGVLWAKVNVTITKTATERLNIYWYVTFERRSSLAIKSGASIATTGNITLNVDSTLTFASAVTIVLIENNSGGVMYVKLNEALVGGASPTNYDFRIPDGERVFLNNEEVSVTTVHVTLGESITMPDNQVSVRGW